jgi:hypothetical protein
VFTVSAGAIGCGGTDGVTPSDPVAAVASVVPVAQATGVDPAAPIVIRFTHPMMAGVEQYVALHEGNTPAGPVVAGRWTWSTDRSTLTFTPAMPLKPNTRYAIHLGGGLRDSMNREVDHAACARQGGTTATPDMMSGTDMMSGGGMMGSGWRHSSGTYGMLFTFTTA